ncbi:unnamed protein product [Periconia digitata]|uniref:Uncharacterized protein n=1 Tax=Periconia digitata TaxID=1303443 RepID=A0A9W4UJN9_9PLEO|nr:unnamed protein product [Periconia digitata]
MQTQTSNRSSRRRKEERASGRARHGNRSARDSLPNIPPSGTKVKRLSAGGDAGTTVLAPQTSHVAKQDMNSNSIKKAPRDGTANVAGAGAGLDFLGRKPRF